MDFMFFSTTWWLKSPKKPTQPVDVSKTRWWDQLPNPPLESPLPLELQQVKTWGALPAHCLLNGFQFSLPETISNSPWKLMGWSTTFLLGWPIFGSYVIFISRWFARFSFTANIQLGLPQCLTLMNWSSSVHPKFVGSNMSRGLVVFWKGVGLLWKETKISQHCRRRCFTSSPEDVSSQRLVNCLLQLRYSIR